jgi:hypothetical protein
MTRGSLTIVAAEMGYGHLRAALPLCDALGIELSHADQQPLAGPQERALWEVVRRIQELLSKPSRLSAYLGKPQKWMDEVTKIPPLFESTDARAPSLGVRALDLLAVWGLGTGLVKHLRRAETALLTTFYAPAIVADRAGCPSVCIASPRTPTSTGSGRPAMLRRLASTTSRRAPASSGDS